MTTRVLLAEDHTIVRAGLRALLDEVEGIEVVGEAGTGTDALKLAAARHPDAVLLDITLPELNGLDVAARLHKDHPNMRIIMLSMHEDPRFVRLAFRAGASGYLVKGGDVSELETALRAAMRGERFLSPSVSTVRIDDSMRGGPASLHPLEALTPRQREILQLIAEGRSTKEAAYRLDVSAKTIEFHRTELMKRLDIHDTAGLVRFAIRHGLISAER